jgi:fanconi anemia group M protein
MLKLIVDSREPDASLVSLLRNLDLEVEVKELASGDFILSEEKGIVVERKTAQDFLNSIFDKRLFSQVAKMKADYESTIVIIEGDVFDTRSNINPEALRGALSWLSVIEGIAVHHTSSIEATAKMLSVMTRHAQEGLGYEVPIRANKPKDKSALVQYLVEGLPGCGPGTAKKLINHFGSARKIFTATEKELIEVPGVGKGLATKLEDILSTVIE